MRARAWFELTCWGPVRTLPFRVRDVNATGAPPGPPSPNAIAARCASSSSARAPAAASAVPLAEGEAAARSTMNLQVLRPPSVAVSALRCGSPGVPCHSAKAHDLAASLKAALCAALTHNASTNVLATTLVNSSGVYLLCCSCTLDKAT